MQHDQPGGVGRWNLGDHGTIEIDSWFVPVAALGDGAHRARGWLWSPHGDVVRVDLVAIPGGDRCVLSLEAHPPLPSRWLTHRAELRALARVALHELDEELRWQAGRAVPASA